MPETCQYNTSGARLCTAPATTSVLGSGRTADWRVGWIDEKHTEFCDLHAGMVAEQRNAQHRAAHAAWLAQPRHTAWPVCAVCDGPVESVV